MWTVTRRRFLVDGQAAHWPIRKFSTIYNELDPQTEDRKQVEFYFILSYFVKDILTILEQIKEDIFKLLCVIISVSSYFLP